MVDLRFIRDANRNHRPLLARSIYAVIVAFSYAFGFVIRFEGSVPPVYADLMLWTLAAVVALRSAVFYFFRLARGRWRYVSTRDVVRLVISTVVGTALIAVANVLLLHPRIPFSVIAIEALLTSMLIAGAWLSYRLLFEHMRRRREEVTDKRVLIIGAGEAGNLLAREISRFPTGYRLVGFVDDASSMAGSSLHGFEVVGTSKQLDAICTKFKLDELIIAIPSASPGQLREIVNRCEATGLPFKVLPGIAQVLAGDVRVTQLREVSIEDLLGREPVNLRLPELSKDLSGQTVLITGAAGSIGSELARQVALHAPALLILLDQAETPLFYLELELLGAHPDLHIIPIVGDVVNSRTIDRVLSRYRPSRVFHAAAYKHVPMMEHNSSEALWNNVIGTWRVADAAGRFGAERFVLVSTDKAVRPANVMGATKRLAELIILELQEQFGKTSYGAVRFGNVLGSAGSVVPVFKRQMARSEPLTVTHPDVTRYFMTIPEAVQLILQASVLSNFRGHIAMLEMGEPIRITDLATNLLRLSGITDVAERIVFTGLRPGEKLHEELVAPDEQTILTNLEKVRIISTASKKSLRFLPQLPQWERHLFASDDLITEILATVIDEGCLHVEKPFRALAVQ